MKQITIPVTFNVSDPAYEAYQNCLAQEYLEEEIAEIMFYSFRKFAYMGSVNQEILRLVDKTNRQLEEMEREDATL